MQLHLLHLDDALTSQAAFLAAANQHAPRITDVMRIASSVRLWGKDAQLSALSDALPNYENSSKHLSFMGSGDFHHVSALLLNKILNVQQENVTVIHFDNHPDWVKCSGGMHCGSWVNRAAAHPHVSKIITLGVTSNDLNWPELKGASLHLLRDGKLELFPLARPSSRVRGDYGDGASHRQTHHLLHWNSIQAQGEDAFLAFILTRIATKNVYFTIDKDVLTTDDAKTNWDQGAMRLPYLLSLIRTIGEHHQVIGADVTGDYSPSRFGGPLLSRLLKHGEILLDQPLFKPAMDEAIRINSTTNLALLSTLSEVMA